MNKLSLVGMQLPEKYNIRRISTRDSLTSLVTRDEGPSVETSKFSLYFSGRCIPTNESL